MTHWFRDLDRILRGEATRSRALGRGSVDVRPGGLTALLVALGMVYGACMGCFALFKEGGPSVMQLVASAVKLPALFLLTLVVTFPSLYVFNALVGSRLSMGSLLRLLLAALGVTVAVLASLGPIVAFFSVSTTSYPFMLLLNVLVFAASGTLGMAFLLQTLHRLSLIPPEPEPEPEPTPSTAIEQVGEQKGEEPAGPSPGALEHAGDGPPSRQVKLIFRCWIVLFALVGAQMGWVLRPFVGTPDRPFSWFRERDSNFFEAVWHAFASLFS
ncbi:hypothetical protein AB1L88_02795 [Tautonia sp. JC769]|uniref:hypothetical protein n=1 Tax=Tautonia sp. JC769 TaxID=3232135 RepID=UPI003457B497